jgi:hypothetical protein
MIVALPAFPESTGQFRDGTFFQAAIQRFIEKSPTR